MLEMLIILIIVAAVVYVIRLLPIDETFKQIAFVIAVVFFAIYVIKHLGALGL